MPEPKTIIISVLYCISINCHAQDDRIKSILTYDTIKSSINTMLEDCSKDQLEYAYTLLECSDICLKESDYIQAGKLLEESYRTFRNLKLKTESDEYTDYMISYYKRKAEIKYEDERHPVSAAIQRKSLNLIKSRYGYSSEEYIEALLKLSETYSEYGKTFLANKYHTEAYGAYSELLRNKFGGMSETSRSIYWSKAQPYFNKTLNITYNLSAIDSPSVLNTIGKDAFNSILLSKSILLTTSRLFDEFAYNTNDSSIIRHMSCKQQLIDNNANTHAIDSVEQLIINRLTEMGLYYDSPHLRYTWKDVQAAIGNDDLVIEFFHLQDNRNQKKLGALLLRKEWNSPLCVRLKDKNDILQQNLPFSLIDDESWLSSETAWKLSKRLWRRNILKHFPKTEEGKVYFSPDGLLSISAIESLPFINPIKQDTLLTFSDCFNMYRLTSSRELCMNESSSDTKSALMIGCPDYDLRRHSYKNAVDTLTNIQPPIKLIDTLYINRIKQKVPRKGSVIASLPNTWDEISYADSILGKNAYKVSLLAGKYATEEAVKKLSDKQSIIHLATHGYYISTDKARVLFNLPEINDPMLRSGIWLTGASSTLINGKYDSTSNDGFLSSREISAFNLQENSIAILSSCSSGFGELSEDGVYGLQRAFKKAGTNSMLMSLWPIHDEATKIFINCFYYNYISKGLDKHNAFKSAQEKLKNDPKYNSPIYWASYILLDGIE